MRWIADGMPEGVNLVVLAVGWALVLFVIQGALIGLGVAALLRAGRDRPAARRSAIALAGLLLLAACPVLTTARALVARPEAPGVLPATRQQGGSVGAEVAAVQSPVQAGETRSGAARWVASLGSRVAGWLPALVAMWALGACVCLVRLALGLVELRALRVRGIEPLPGELQAVVERLSTAIGRRRPVACRLSRRVQVPSVLGWRRPLILLPVAGLGRLTASQTEAVLAHELAHVQRHDVPVHLAQAVLESLLFFHPAVWWVSRQVRIEREHGCDEVAVALCGGDRRLVARALFRLEELRAGSWLGVAATGASLRDRIERLVTPAAVRPVRGRSGWASAGLVTVLAGMLGLGVPPGLPRSQASDLGARDAAAMSGPSEPTRRDAPQDPGAQRAPAVVPEPTLDLKLIGPDEGAAGSTVRYRIVVTNTGREVARDVIVAARVDVDSRPLAVTPRGATWSALNRTFTWKVSEVPSQERREFTIDVQLGGAPACTIRAGSKAQEVPATQRSLETRIRATR